MFENSSKEKTPTRVSKVPIRAWPVTNKVFLPKLRTVMMEEAAHTQFVIPISMVPILGLKPYPSFCILERMVLEYHMIALIPVI